jgi:YesN/AraC family two-component response regulator
MIDYNYGFLLSLPLQDKMKLKESLEAISGKINEQENNKIQAQEQISNGLITPKSHHNLKDGINFAG